MPNQRRAFGSGELITVNIPNMSCTITRVNGSQLVFLNNELFIFFDWMNQVKTKIVIT